MKVDGRCRQNGCYSVHVESRFDDSAWLDVQDHDIQAGCHDTGS